MRKRSERILIAFVVCAVLLVSIYTFLAYLGEHRRTYIIAELRNPPQPVVARKQILDDHLRPLREERVSSKQLEPRPIESTDEEREIQKLLLGAIGPTQRWSRDPLIDQFWKSINWRAPYHDWSEESWSLLEQCFSAHPDLVEGLYAFVEGGSVLRWVDTPDFSDGVAAVFEIHERMGGWGGILCLDEALKIHNGDYTEAGRGMIAAMKLAHTLVDTPTVRMQRASQGTVGGVGKLVHFALEHGPLPPETARAMLTQLDHADHRDAFLTAIECDRYRGLVTFSDLRDPDRKAVFENLLTSVEDNKLLLHPVMRPVLNWDEQVYAKSMKRCAELAQIPFYEARPELETLDKRLNRQWRPVSTEITWWTAGTPSVICAQQAEHEVRVDFIQTAILLDQYRQTNGRYPDTVDAIAEDLGGTLPTDPITGGSYQYSSDGSSFTLFSTGRNQLTDHDDIIW